MTSTLHVGPMRSGKSLALLEEIQALESEGVRVKCYKPDVDNRNGPFIFSRGRDLRVPATLFRSTGELIDKIDKDFKIRDKTKFTYIDSPTVVLDEIMLCDTNIIMVLFHLAQYGIDFIAAGLRTDYLNRPFRLRSTKVDVDTNLSINFTMEDLQVEFDRVVEHKANCDICFKQAEYTVRLVDSTEDILIGDKEYGVRCKECLNNMRLN